MKENFPELDDMHSVEGLTKYPGQWKTENHSRTLRASQWWRRREEPNSGEKDRMWIRSKNDVIYCSSATNQQNNAFQGLNKNNFQPRMQCSVIPSIKLEVEEWYFETARLCLPKSEVSQDKLPSRKSNIGERQSSHPRPHPHGRELPSPHQLWCSLLEGEPGLLQRRWVISAGCNSWIHNNSHHHSVY